MNTTAALSHHHMLLLHGPSHKTLTNPSPSIPFFITPTLYFPSRPNSLCRRSFITASSSSPDTQTLPQSAIRRIAEKLRSLGYGENNEEDNQTLPQNTQTRLSSPGQIFIPLPTQLPKYRVGHTLDPSWSTPENPVPLPGSGNAIQRFHEMRDKAEKEKEEERLRRKGMKKENVPTLAELTLPAAELRRLRAVGIRLKKSLKVGKAGITEGIVNGIHERWRGFELVRIKCDDICSLNMKRTHELLEKKTGGLVIWRSGSNIILYRGSDYKYPYFSADNSTRDTSDEISPDLHTEVKEHPGRMSISSAKPDLSSGLSHPPLVRGVGTPDKVRFQLPGEAQLAEEVDRLLEGLGPRFTDWWGYDPLPIDGDLLPAVVPGYKRPFRLLPYGVSPKLTNDEMTILKRLGRPLPCHFVLGRNRKLQGLAASIVKLWDKSEIAKIAIKRGVQNTNSELMAEELKRLTGGILLSRDKEFITFYRGKDFLPAAVSSALEEKRKRRIEWERNRDDNSPLGGTEEYQDQTSECAPDDQLDGEDDLKENFASGNRQQESTEAAVRRTNSRLSMALAKKARAEKLLAELDKEEISQEPEVDKEGIIEEERYMLRKIGLRMKPFLLLGRRGVFDGTIENMHLHWKYRELVKILVGRKSIEEVHEIARTLETESGGILVAVERVSKGYVIIVYRGKNYKRPSCLRPRTLLSKREAMKRSLEAQRRESLKLHVLKLTGRIDELKLQLAKTNDSKDIQLAEDVKLGLVQVQEVENIQSGENERFDALPAANSPSLAGNSCDQQADSTAPSAKEHLDFLKICMDDDVQHDMQSNKSQQLKEQEFLLTEGGALQESVSQVFTVSSDMQMENLKGETSYSMTSDESTTSHAISPRSGSRLSVQQTVRVEPERPCRALSLSNRERLLLRKQALKLEKRPLFAVGKSNLVTGLAKAIKAHFEKHPLAIVNVKGRAKGTSVREVVFKLEEATGAVLVSQEPSKIILYRGWGAAEAPAEEPAYAVWKANRGRTKRSIGDGFKPQYVVSPELISAIRLECGLQDDLEKDSAP